MNNWVNDLKIAIRNLRRNPSFALVTLITLAAGIGPTSAIFSVVNVFLFRPFPYANADRLVHIERHHQLTGAEMGMSYPVFEVFRERQTSFEHLVGWSVTQATVGRAGNAGVHTTQLVSGDFFQALGVPPVLGRLLTPEDDLIPRAHPVVVLGHDYWQRKLDGDASVVGSVVALNGHDFTVIGVAPPDFKGLVLPVATDFWVPMMMQPLLGGSAAALEDHQNSWMSASGVLKPGVTLDVANAELALIMSQLRESDSELYGHARASAFFLTGMGLNPNDRQGIFIMGTAVLALGGSVLLIACANIAFLLMARSMSRRREIGVRLALGSTRGRIVRQLLCESLILALSGGLIGLLLSTWLMKGAMWIVPQLPMNLDLHFDFQIDARVLAFALGVSAVTAVVSGLVPSLQATRVDLIPALKDEDSGSVGFRRSRVRSGLIVGQVAVSLMLLIIAGLFVRSLINSRWIDSGFEYRSTLAVLLRLDPVRYNEATGRVFYRRLLERVNELPGVQSASLDFGPPLGLIERDRYSFVLEGDQLVDADGSIRGGLSHGSIVSPGALETLGIPLLGGRDFNDLDLTNASRVVIVNDQFAKTYWPDESPLGQRIGILTGSEAESGVLSPGGSSGNAPVFAEVIGVAKTVKHSPYDDGPQPFVYQPLSQVWQPELTMLVRGSGDPMAMLPTIQEAIGELDSTVVPLDVRPYGDIISFIYMPSMLIASLSTFFGALALLLSMVGLYSVMSYMVAQRTREIGIRIAVGARAVDVTHLVLGRGLRLAGIGLVLGVVAALGISRALDVLLLDVSAADPLTYVVIAAFLIVVATLATLIPARRAMRVDPMVALRYE